MDTDEPGMTCWIVGTEDGPEEKFERSLKPPRERPPRPRPRFDVWPWPRPERFAGRDEFMM